MKDVLVKFYRSFDDISKSVNEAIDEAVLTGESELLDALFNERAFGVRDIANFAEVDIGILKKRLSRSIVRKISKVGAQLPREQLYDQMAAEIQDDIELEVYYRSGIFSIDDVCRYWLLPPYYANDILDRVFENHTTLRHRVGKFRRLRRDETRMTGDIESVDEKIFRRMIMNDASILDVCFACNTPLEATRRKLLSLDIPIDAIDSSELDYDESDIELWSRGKLSMKELLTRSLMTSEQFKTLDVAKMSKAVVNNRTKLRFIESLEERLDQPENKLLAYSLDEINLMSESQLEKASIAIRSGHSISKICECFDLDKNDVNQYCNEHAKPYKLSSRAFGEVSKLWSLRLLAQYPQVVSQYCDCLIYREDVLKLTGLPERIAPAAIRHAVGEHYDDVKTFRISRHRALSASYIDFTSRVDKDLYERVFKPIFDEMTDLQIYNWMYEIKSEHNEFFIRQLLAQYILAYGEPDVFPKSRVCEALKFGLTQTEQLRFEKDGLISIDRAKSKLSGYELDVAKVLQDWNVGFKMSDWSVLSESKQELDIIIPDKRIAIELSPVATHNSNSAYHYRDYGPKPEDYHYEKYKRAADAGYELITLYSKQLDEFDKTIEWLKTKLGLGVKTIYARNCEILKAESKQAQREVDEFLDKYHLQGSTRQAKVRFKLVDKHSGELVGVFTVSQVISLSSQKSNIAGWLELKRLCYKPGIRIVGGTSKCVKHIERLYKNEFAGLVSYSNNDIGNGLSYEKAGFSFDKETGPSKVYVARGNSSDVYSYQISMLRSAAVQGRGVIAKDRAKKGLAAYDASNPFDIEEYIECELSHRQDDGKGYDKLCTSGSKRWIMPWTDTD